MATPGSPTIGQPPMSSERKPLNVAMDAMPALDTCHVQSHPSHDRRCASGCAACRPAACNHTAIFLSMIMHPMCCQSRRLAARGCSAVGLERRRFADPTRQIINAAACPVIPWAALETTHARRSHTLEQLRRLSAVSCPASGASSARPASVRASSPSSRSAASLRRPARPRSSQSCARRHADRSSSCSAGNLCRRHGLRVKISFSTRIPP